MISDTSIWASLPVPAVLIGADDSILDVNSAGEGFLNASAKSATRLEFATWKGRCPSVLKIWSSARR